MAAGTPEYGSDVIVEMLRALGIEYAAFNPGSSFRGIHDSLVNYAGNNPRVIECTHEEISVAIAHGYAKAAGKPMAAIVHDVVGLQHASMAMYNAWCDRVPVVVLGGTGPMDASRRRPWIDWIHTANVQGSLVRDYTKFDDQPATLAAVPEALIRAVQLAATPPGGPVYVCFDVDLQEAPIAQPLVPPDVSAFCPPLLPGPDPAVPPLLVEWLTQAERPVLIADRVGFDQRAVDALVELSELLALPVIGSAVSLNFPTLHALNFSEDIDLAAEADLVLGLECRDLFGALHRADPAGTFVSVLAAGAKVAHVTLDMYATRSWTSDYQRLQPAELTVPAAVLHVLRALLPLAREAMSQAAVSARVAARRERLAVRQQRQRERWHTQAQSARGQRPLALSEASEVLLAALEPHDPVLSSGTFGGWMHRLWDVRHTSQYLGTSGGAGLGYGLGAAIGVALANRGNGRVIVDIQSDGDALFTPGALWTMAQQQLPVLVVMDNNRAYQNSVDHADRVARARHRPPENRGVGTDIAGPEVDFATLARSFGVHGEGPVDDAASLRAALDRALRVVAGEGRPALVDVLTQRR